MKGEIATTLKTHLKRLNFTHPTSSKWFSRFGKISEITFRIFFSFVRAKCKMQKIEVSENRRNNQHRLLRERGMQLISMSTFLLFFFGLEQNSTIREATYRRRISRFPLQLLTMAVLSIWQRCRAGRYSAFAWCCRNPRVWHWKLTKNAKCL